MLSKMKKILHLCTPNIASYVIYLHMMKSTTILATLSALSVASTAAVECPNSIDLDAWTEKELQSGLSLKYTVVLAPDGPEESLFCARLECDSENWVAFGISPSGMYVLLWIDLLDINNTSVVTVCGTLHHEGAPSSLT